MYKMTRCLIASLALLASSAFAQLQQSAPFIPQPGGTRGVAVTASAQSLSLATPALPGPLMQLAVQTADVTAGSCTATTYIRTDGTPAATTVDMPVLPKVVFLISVPSSTAALSVIGDATGCKFFATVGAGQ